jgi:hypothetical protein
MLEVGPGDILGLGVGGGEVSVTGRGMLALVEGGAENEVVDTGYGFSGSSVGDNGCPPLAPFV